MEKNVKKSVIVTVMSAIILIIAGIIITVFTNKKADQEKLYYATFIVDGNRHHDNDIPIIDGYISRLPSSPTKESYIFDHWEIDGKEYTGNEILTSDVTLVAVFREYKEEKAIVTFNKDNGEKSTIKEINKYDKVTPISNPKKVGYEFIGWYREGWNELFSFDEQIDEDITLTAKWEILVYKVNFDSNGGSSIGSQKVDYGQKAETPKLPTREGYKFLGWYLNNKKYDLDNKVTKDITLIAKWEVISCTVKFDSDGGSKIDSQKVKYNANAAKPANPTKEGYKFIEWTVDGKTYDFNSKITKDITLVAKWEKTEAKIAYGDVNEDGNINNDDLLLITKQLEKLLILSEQKRKNADINADGKVDNTDLILLRRYLENKYDGDTLPNSPITNYAIYGDFNNDGLFTSLDCSNLERYIKYNEIKLNEQDKKNLDINTDGKVDNTDLNLINQYNLGLHENTLPYLPIIDYIMYGDVDENGIVNNDDVLKITKYLENEITLNKQAIKNSDVNKDGKINNVDKILILRYSEGWYMAFEPSLPVVHADVYVMYGDIDENGFINNEDAVMLQKYLNNDIELDNQGKKNADVNWDREVNNTDYNLLLDYLKSEHVEGAIPTEPLGY